MADTSIMHGDINEPRRSKKDIIKSICDLVGKEGDRRRPLRVVIIGKRGAGKSSFINSIATAFSGSWHEYSSSGFSSGSVYSYTAHILRFLKCCLKKDARYGDVLLPTLIDVPGLSEQRAEHFEELLRLLLYGHIKEESTVHAVYEDIKNMNKTEFQEKYSEVYEDMKADRLVFLASAENDIPENLVQCAYKVARPYHDREHRRTVPIFGVLTNADKVDTTTTSFIGKQDEYMKWLGLNETRFLLCKNYFGGRSMGDNDEIDLPILEFMERLCDPALRVIREDELLFSLSFTDRLWKRMRALYAFYGRNQGLMLILFLALVLLVFVMLR